MRPTCNLPGVADLRGAMVYQAIESAQYPIRIVWISPGVESLIGVASDEVVTDIQKLLRFADPDDGVEHRRKREASMRSGTPFEVLIRFHLPGGETRWIQDHCSPLPQEDGSTLRHGVAVDMTSQELAKQKLAEQELMRRQLGDNLPSGGSFVVSRMPPGASNTPPSVPASRRSWGFPRRICSGTRSPSTIGYCRKTPPPVGRGDRNSPWYFAPA